MTLDAEQRRHDLREVFNALRWLVRSGARSGYEGAKRGKGSTVHLAVDTLGHLLGLHVTPTGEQDRAQVDQLAQAVQEVTGQTVEVAFVDQGYTGEQTQAQAEKYGIDLLVAKETEAKKGSSCCRTAGALNAASAGPPAFVVSRSRL